MKVGPNMIAVIDYQLYDEGGGLIESSSEESPFRFTVGSGSIIPGLEKGLEGMEPGESKKIVVKPDEGYGDKDPNLIQDVPRDRFPEGIPFEKGMSYMARTDAGQMVSFQVLDFSEESVEIDMNHPLAGMTLHFEVTVRDVLEPE